MVTTIIAYNSTLRIFRPFQLLPIYWGSSIIQFYYVSMRMFSNTSSIFKNMITIQTYMTALCTQEVVFFNSIQFNFFEFYTLLCYVPCCTVLNSSSIATLRIIPAYDQLM